MAAVAVGPTALAAPVACTLDPSHSFVTFEMLHFDTATIRSRFGPLACGLWVTRCG